MKASDSLTAIGALTAGLALLGAFATPVLARPSKAPTALVAQPAPAPQPAASAPMAAAEPNAPEADLSRPWPEPLWLSETSANRAGSKKSQATDAPSQVSDHQNHAGMGAGGAPMASVQADAAEAMVDMAGSGGPKTLWLRRGGDPATAPNAKLADEHIALRIVASDGKHWEAPLTQDARGGLQAKVDLPTLGFYDAYLLRQSVQGGVLDVQLAKAELLKGTCCSKRDNDLYKPAEDNSLPIEIIRAHGPDEKLMTHITSGEKAVFFVRSYGKPVAGAKVSIETQEGWGKHASTNADGRVEFTLVRDYFPDWSDFNRRKTGTFLVLAEVERPEAGAIDGQNYSVARYQTSIAGRYYPAPYDYQSYAYALSLILGVATFGGLAVWLHRHRRARPFKEIRFNEQAA